MDNMKECERIARYRYENDHKYHKLVDMLEEYMLTEKIHPNEVHDAVNLAADKADRREYKYLCNNKPSKVDEINKCLNKYLHINNRDCVFRLKIKEENNIVMTEYYDVGTKVITLYEDKTSGEVGIIENWKVK